MAGDQGAGGGSLKWVQEAEGLYDFYCWAEETHLWGALVKGVLDHCLHRETLCLSPAPIPGLLLRQGPLLS